MSPDLSWSLASAGVPVACAVLYGRRWCAVRRSRGRDAASGWRLLSFATGLLVVLVALVSPVGRLGEQLFVMHMVQHVLLTDVASILVMLGLTPALVDRVVRWPRMSARGLEPLSRPTFAVVFYALTLWLWHTPPMYQGALELAGVHALQHLNFAAAALLFWGHVLSPTRSRERLAGPNIILYFAGAKLLNGVLAIAIIFWPSVLYPYYAGQPRFWALSALYDQELAGAVLMIEESVVLFVAFVALFVRMLGESEEDERRAEA